MIIYREREKKSEKNCQKMALCKMKAKQNRSHTSAVFGGRGSASQIVSECGISIE